MTARQKPNSADALGQADAVPQRKATILIVEDDRDLNNLLKYNLEVTRDFQVYSHFTGVGAFDRINEISPDLIILDVMLPGEYGTEILKRVRDDSHLRAIPVILLTARSQEEDKVAGFEAGADDYITKPFSPRELLLRVNALLRRTSSTKPAQESDKERTLQVGPIRIQPSDFLVFVDDENIPLTPTEFQLLHFLAERAGRLQSRDSLLQKVWGYEGNVNTRTVDTHVKRLRQKLGTAGALIETVHGFGYRLVQNAKAESESEFPSDSLS